jgi:UDP-N-acetylmuramate dehydrogenase
VKLHEFVLWTIDQNFGGLENMSLIPGNVTTPVKTLVRNRNKDTFVSCEAMAIESQDMKTFTRTNVILDTEKAF